MAVLECTLVVPGQFQNFTGGLTGTVLGQQWGCTGVIPELYWRLYMAALGSTGAVRELSRRPYRSCTGVVLCYGLYRGSGLHLDSNGAVLGLYMG